MLIYAPQMNDHARAVARVLAIVFVLNIVVAAAKLIWGIATGSVSMQADGIHSSIDSLGNVVGLIGIFLAGRPADKSHPYGHSKFEIFASLAIGFMLLIAAYEVGSGAITRLVNSEYSARVDAISFAVMIGTLVVNVVVTTYEHRAGQRLKSEVLKADAKHTLSDVLTSLGVLAGLVAVALGFPMADPIVALIVTLFIIYSAVSVFREAFRSLSDHAQLPVDEIQEMASEMPGIKEVHAVRSRGTEAEIYCDLHLLVDPDITVRTAHALGDQLELEVKKHWPNVREVLVHVEPYGIEQLNEDTLLEK